MYKVRGTVYNVEFDQIKGVFSSFFGADKLAVKIRIFGEEIIFNDEDIELHGETSFDEAFKINNFFIDMSCFFDEKKTISLINKLEILLKREDLIYEFEYRKEDDKGRELSQEVNIRHPDYFEFIKRFSKHERD